MNWSKCKRCVLHRYRKRVVYGAGSIPADILFIGEAPGKSEDLLGEPFIGPSGAILRESLWQAMELSKTHRVPSYYITNVLACRPCDGKTEPNRQPTKEEAEACNERIQEIFSKVKPQHVVYLGKIAQRFSGKTLRDKPNVKFTSLQHPAYLLRMGGIGTPLHRLFIRELVSVFKSLKRGKQRAIRIKARDNA